nr:hypothetical protein [Leptospira fletcheri]
MMPEADRSPKISPELGLPAQELGIVPPERVDLIPEEELRNLLLQTNPKAMRDLDLIEKGVENFFLFSQSPFALAKFEQLQFLKPADLTYFENKNGFVLYQYMFVSEETKELGLSNVVLRPASRKSEQVQKIKLACLAQSASAFLQFIHRRDFILMEKKNSGELREWVQRQYINTDEKGNPVDFQDSKNLALSMRNLITFSMESFLQRNLKLNEEILGTFVSILSKKQPEIAEFLAQIKTEGDAITALERRGNRPPLLQLHPEFHLVQPSLDELINDSSPDSKTGAANEETEMEIVYEIFISLARRILVHLLPAEQTSWIQSDGMMQGSEFLAELRRHPAFTSGKNWEGSDLFLQAFEVLIQSMNSLSALRKESLVNLAFTDIVIRIRETKEPLVVDQNSIKLKDGAIQAAGLNKAEILDQILEKIKSRNDILKREKTTGSAPGLLTLALENVIPAFLYNKDKRTSVHNLIRKNGQAKGIYAFLREVTEGVDSEVAIDEQLRLSKAISEWEKETEKQKRKAEQDSKSWIVRLLEWILGLFGIAVASTEKKDFEILDDSIGSTKSAQKQASPKSETAEPQAKRKKSLGVIVGPKEKSLLIPPKLQKVIDYVDRNNNGLIWLDEVVNTVASPEFGKDKVADLIYYDQKRRYIEIRSMNSVRHVFIRKELEFDSAWLDSVLEYLENVTAKNPEFAALADTLRKFREE